MKRRALLLIIVMMMIMPFVFGVLGCSKDVKPTEPDGEHTGGEGGEGDDGGDEIPDVPDETERTVYFKVNNNTAVVMTKRANSGTTDTTDIYYVSTTLAVGDMVFFYDDSNNVYQSYATSDFNGTAKLAGVYAFELRITGTSGVIYVTPPSTKPTPETPVDPETPSTPRNTKINVYYTNNNGWNKVYAYIWNNSTGASKKAWPGEELSVCGTSGFGEKQYSVLIDCTVYDRVIFNNGGNSQTKDLVVSSATSGYYGEDGIFTMDATDYGKVTYTTLTDATNLSYTSSKSKKISVYTPPGYSTAKKYGVLYMFDGQNLYTDGSSTQPASNPWAVDVAVTNLMKNGGAGIIIVAIDNTESSRQRDQELTMSPSFGTLTSLGGSQYGYFTNGKLDDLGNFIKQTLMPWVKDHYSVDTSREKTGIAGSSSGGLAAYYLGLRDNDLYGYIGAFSPANGIFQSSDWTRFYASKSGFSAGKPNVYVYCGYKDNDLEDMLVTETRKIKSGLTAAGFAASSIIENYVEGGTHNESYWRIAFTEFLGKLAP
ncbi:MAG: starch-binding protein [Clostridiales bacterium]|nr:starch-binding protein [Clostridiales bacterium]